MSKYKIGRIQLMSDGGSVLSTESRDKVKAIFASVLQGPGSSGSDKFHKHDQEVSSSTWTISHNFGRFPNIVIYDSAGDEVQGDVVHIDPNSTRVNFSAAFAGTAFLT